MTQPTTRTTFKDYCKRKLGHPVIELNLDDDQIEDTIDDAVAYWQEYHFDGTHPEYVKKQITASTQIVSSTSGTFSAGETIEGGSSGIKATINDYISANTTIRYSKPTTKNNSNAFVASFSKFIFFFFSSSLLFMGVAKTLSITKMFLLVKSQ